MNLNATRILGSLSMFWKSHGPTICVGAGIAGAVGAGGLGNYAIMYGHDRNQLDVTWLTIIVLVIIVNLVQLGGNKIIKRNRH